MTITADLKLSSNAGDPKTAATHKMRHDGTLARKGSDGRVEIWGFGQWLRTDHSNKALDDTYGFFVKLTPKERL